MATLIFELKRSSPPLRGIIDDGLLPVLGVLAGLFLAANLVLPSLLTGGWNLYVAQPLRWCGLGAFCFSRTGRSTIAFSKPMIGLALLCGGFQVAALLIAGLLYGFGYSGYAHTPTGIAANLWYLGSMLFGVEAARAFLLRRLVSKPVASFFAIALLFGLLNLSLDQLLAVSNGRGGLMLGGERLLPSLATSLLATLLSILGGPWAAIAYRGSLMAFEWLSPVLPALPWLPAAVAGTLAPGAAFTLVQSMTAPPPEAAPSAEARRKPAHPTWLLPFALAIAAAVWFNTGLFGVQPAVVSGISMEPNLSLGDIVVTRGVDPASVAVGDVIKFRSGAVSVLHRVQEVQQGSNGRVFVTKGDNNNYLDPPVPEAALQGEVVLVIPKAGLLPVLVKSWLAR